MIELPEAITIARQMDNELKGRRIAEAIRGNSPHKFAFYNHDPEEYAALLTGKMIGASSAHFGLILTEIEPDHALVLGGGGERIFLHTNEKTLPAKHQFFLRFADGAFLTVSIQMWGVIQVMPAVEVPNHPFLSSHNLTPLDDGFTLDYFLSLFNTLEPNDPRSVKYFIISKPGLPGLGNGYLQDILFRAGLHPRHVATKLYADQKEALYEAVCETIQQAVALGGRDSELDLYGCPGHYPRILHSKMVGLPCPECGTAIEKENYLGGAVYYCPRCQQ